MVVAAMQGANQHIRSSLGFSILPKDTLTCQPGESNQQPSDNKMLALFLGLYYKAGQSLQGLILGFQYCSGYFTMVTDAAHMFKTTKHRLLTNQWKIHWSWVRGSWAPSCCLWFFFPSDCEQCWNLLLSFFTLISSYNTDKVCQVPLWKIHFKWCL